MISGDDITDTSVKRWYLEKNFKGDAKFTTIGVFDFVPNFDFNLTRRLTKSSICLVYAVWSNPQYLKFLHISLVSQFKFTDVSTADIKVFVDPKLEEQARELLPGISIVIIEGVFNKYSITLHQELHDYDRVIICDCDTFMYGEKQPFYFDVSNLSTDTILMMEDPEENARKVFENRVVLSKFRDQPGEVQRYTHAVASVLGMSITELHDMLENHRWYLSCMMVYPSHIFTSDDWKEHVQRFSALNSWCDETVFLTYAWTRGFEVGSLNQINEKVRVVLAAEARDFIRSPKNLGIVHPLHGTYCEDVTICELYDDVLQAEVEDDQEAPGFLNSARSEFWEPKPGVLKKKCKRSEGSLFEDAEDIKRVLKDSDLFIEIYEIFDDQTYTMQYLKGARRWPRLSDEEKQNYTSQIKDAYDFLIDHGYFHNSLDQPGNILVKEGKIYICDLDCITRLEGHEKWETTCRGRVKEAYEITFSAEKGYQGYTYESVKVEGAHDTERKFQKYGITPDLLKGKKVLDIGCAEGYMSLWSSEWAKEVVAVDSCQSALQTLSSVVKKLNITNISIEHACVIDFIRKSPFFDVTFCFSVLHLLAEPDMFIKELSQHTDTCFFEVDTYKGSSDDDYVYIRKRIFDSDRRHLSIEEKSLRHLFYIYFNSVEYKGKSMNGRSIYKCSTIACHGNE